MWAPTEDVFEQERDTLHATYGESHHAVVEYLQATWLSRKENFVLAWTKRGSPSWTCGKLTHGRKTFNNERMDQCIDRRFERCV